MRHYWIQAEGAASSDPPSLETLPGSMTVQRIVAQGRLLPRGGLVNVLVPPGQRVDRILVAEKDRVVAGQSELLTLHSQQLLGMQAEMAAARKAEVAVELEKARQGAGMLVREAESAVASARLALDQARSPNRLKIAESELAAARLELAGYESLSRDPLTSTLVSRQQLALQAMKVDSLTLQLEDARQQQQRALEIAELNLSQAAGGLEDARAAAASAERMERESRSPRLAEEIALEQLQQARILAPADGTVLRVMLQPGETVTQLPVMQIGDIDRMECIAEVSEVFAARVRPGQTVTIRSPALEKPLGGEVISVGTVVGSATLPEPNPLALVDRRTVEVRIALDDDSNPAARQFVNLQVAVEIAADGIPEQSGR